MSEVFHVEKRTECGKARNRRLRRGGRLPAVLYGHGKDSVSLSLSADEVDSGLRHGVKVVDLSGAETGQALLQDVQWDVFFKHVLHVDLLRIEAGDVVTVTVPVELRGEAPGVNEGGVLDQAIHELEIEVTPANVPEKLHINVNHLALNESLTVADIEDMPANAKTTAEPDLVIVSCNEPTALPDEDEEIAGVGEPEVIGQKDDEGEEGASSE